MQPEWFRQYIEQQPSHQTVQVDGARIHYQQWLAPNEISGHRRSLVFVHGHAAHAHWWDFIAPAFTRDYDIVALDLSGSGDSEHRNTYSANGFAQEIAAVAGAAGLSSPIIIGHSFGGAMTRVAAYLHEALFSGIILVDSAIPNRKGSRQPPPMPRVKERYYPSVEEGMRRFRLRPPQPCEHQFIVDYIAEHSLRATDRGYQFKYDSAVFAKMEHRDDFPVASEMIRHLSIPVGVIYGENSRFFPAEAVNELRELIPPAAIRCVADAHHHVFLDQPLDFIKTLNILLEKQFPSQ